MSNETAGSTVSNDLNNQTSSPQQPPSTTAPNNYRNRLSSLVGSIHNNNPIESKQTSSMLITDNYEKEPTDCDDNQQQQHDVAALLNQSNLTQSQHNLDNLRLINDFRICLFGSALFSGKSTTLLKPYPPEYFDSNLGEIRSEQLMQIFHNIPSLDSIQSQNNNNNCDNSESIELLDWIISHGSIEFRHIRSIDQIDQNQPKAKEILLENFQIDKSTATDVASPSSLSNVIVVEFKQNRSRGKLETFQKLKTQYGSFYAFHGSALPNFHSILHNGLANSLNKRSLFGFGTYLSSKLCVAIQYSPFGLNPFHRKHRGSIFGNRMSCVALCEIIDHPDVQAKKKQNDMPNTYYVVSNNELIRIAYILIYSSATLDLAKFNLIFQQLPSSSLRKGPTTSDAKNLGTRLEENGAVAQQPQPQQQLQGRISRRANDNSEPNTSYSNAFLIVIIVCFIAIGLLMTRKTSNSNKNFEF